MLNILIGVLVVGFFVSPPGRVILAGSAVLVMAGIALIVVVFVLYMLGAVAAAIF